MAGSIREKAQKQYGGEWNVIIYDAKCAIDLKFQVETTKGSYINVYYDGLSFYIFPNNWKNKSRDPNFLKLLY